MQKEYNDNCPKEIEKDLKSFRFSVSDRQKKGENKKIYLTFKSQGDIIKTIKEEKS